MVGAHKYSYEVWHQFFVLKGTKVPTSTLPNFSVNCAKGTEASLCYARTRWRNLQCYSYGIILMSLKENLIGKLSLSMNLYLKLLSNAVLREDSELHWIIAVCACFSSIIMYYIMNGSILINLSRKIVQLSVTWITYLVYKFILSTKPGGKPNVLNYEHI
jgi:hypothetical protein